MTFDWQKAISETFDPAPAIAFNATAIGAIALLFIWKDWWPLSSGEAITAPTAGMLVLWGGVCLARPGVGATPYAGIRLRDMFFSTKGNVLWDRRKA